MYIIDVFLVIISLLLISIALLTALTSYEFYKLDYQQFKYYIIGLPFYLIAVLSFLIQYIVLPPLTKTENAICGSIVRVTSLIGLLFFIINTQRLAKIENPNFHEEKKLHSIFPFLVIATCLFSIAYLPTLYISKDIYNILSVISLILFITLVFLAAVLFFHMIEIFNPPLDGIILHNVIAIIMFFVAGIAIIQILEPLETNGEGFRDISNFRASIATFALAIGSAMFLICFKCVDRLRKALYS